MLQSVFNTVCCCCYPIWDYSNSYITINGRRYKLHRLLNENALSFTYMVNVPNVSNCLLTDPDSDSNNLVLKQIICPFGNIECVSDALTEIENYKSYDSKYIIKCVDSEIIQSDDGSKTVMILLPYYPRGSLRDLINYNILDGTNYMSEKEVIRLMIGVCKGLLLLHDPTTREESRNGDNGTNPISLEINRNASSSLIGTPLEMNLLSSPKSGYGSFIHLNIEPSSILLSNEGTPVISELVSTYHGELEIKSDIDVSTFKKWIASHCNTYYTAPEVINIKKNSSIDCSADIWSLGCVLYTLLFGISPFDREEQINGMPLHHNISKGLYSIPQNTSYSQGLIDVIKSCLKVDSVMRATINEVLTQLQNISS